MAKFISDADFNKVANFFGTENVRRAKNGGTAIIITPKNNVINDNRDNTVDYALYLYEDGFRWRRKVTIWCGWNGWHRYYQLFRNGINYQISDWGSYPTDYVYHSFATVEEALARFVKYANNINIAA